MKIKHKSIICAVIALLFVGTLSIAIFMLCRSRSVTAAAAEDHSYYHLIPADDFFGNGDKSSFASLALDSSDDSEFKSDILNYGVELVDRSGYGLSCVFFSGSYYVSMAMKSYPCGGFSCSDNGEICVLNDGSTFFPSNEPLSLQNVIDNGLYFYDQVVDSDTYQFLHKYFPTLQFTLLETGTSGGSSSSGGSEGGGSSSGGDDDAAYRRGYDEGYEEGDAAGYDRGFDEGNAKGYTTGYSNGLNKALSDSITNPVSFFIEPVQTFLDTKLFGNFSLGTALNVVLFVSFALIFIKMFAGG